MKKSVEKKTIFWKGSWTVHLCIFNVPTQVLSAIDLYVTTYVVIDWTREAINTSLDRTR